MILMVCTANVCRSPYAEALLSGYAARAGRLGVNVKSAGTHAARGQSFCSSAAALLQKAGVGSDTAKDHRPRQLDLDLVQGAELILVASRQQRSEIAHVDAAARRRTFTFKEAAAYLSELASQRNPSEDVPERGGLLPQTVEAMNSLRGTVAIPEGAPVALRSLLSPAHSSAQRRLDVRDGHLQSPLHHKSALKEVHQAIDKIHRGLSVVGAY